VQSTKSGLPHEKGKAGGESLPPAVPRCRASVGQRYALFGASWLRDAPQSSGIDSTAIKTSPMLIAAIFVILFACLAGTLLWRLAIYALPLWCAGAVAWTAYQASAGIMLSLLAGAAAAMSILVFGHLALGAARSPLFRAGIGLAFAIPAAVAGYHAAHGIAAAFGGAGWSAAALSTFAAVITGGAAWGGILRPRDQS
jgi:hypothetical protein